MRLARRRIKLSRFVSYPLEPHYQLRFIWSLNLRHFLLAVSSRYHIKSCHFRLTASSRATNHRRISPGRGAAFVSSHTNIVVESRRHLPLANTKATTHTHHFRLTAQNRVSYPPIALPPFSSISACRRLNDTHIVDIASTPTRLPQNTPDSFVPDATFIPCSPSTLTRTHTNMVRDREGRSWCRR
jgi:hypothetical protein